MVEVVQVDPAEVGGDRGGARGPRRHRRDQGGQDRAGVAPGDHDVAVDAATSVGQHALHRERLGLAEQQVRDRERVDAHVEQGAGAEGGVPHPAGRVGRHPEADLGVQVARGAEPAGPQVAGHGPDHGVARRPHRLHQEAVVRGGEPDHRLGLGGVEGQRLLAQHVLAGLEGEPGVVEVQGVGGGDVHDVDGGVGDQLGVGPVGRGAAVRVGEGLGGGERAGADRHQLGAGGDGQVLGEAVGDAAGREDAPAGRRRHAWEPTCGPGIGGSNHTLVIRGLSWVPDTAPRQPGRPAHGRPARHLTPTPG